MESRPIPIRLDEDVIARLERAAKKLGGAPRSVVIKLAIMNQLPAIESGVLRLNGGRT